MKKDQIQKGGRYLAKVSGKLTVVLVEEIREVQTYRRSRFGGSDVGYREVYDVRNEATGRRTTFKAASKFRGPAEGTGKLLNGQTRLLAAGDISPLPEPIDNQEIEKHELAVRRGGYVCPHCHEIHVSDNTELWCGLAKDAEGRRRTKAGDADPASP